MQEALNDLNYWKKPGNKVIQKRISKLIQSIEKTPYEGIGKPEGLKYHHSGKWSRRITGADRIIYEVDQENFLFILCGGLRKVKSDTNRKCQKVANSQNLATLNLIPASWPIHPSPLVTP